MSIKLQLFLLRENSKKKLNQNQKKDKELTKKEREVLLSKIEGRNLIVGIDC